MRVVMLVPHGGVRGPMPRLAQLLVEGLRSVGCDVTTEPWGRRSDGEARLSKVPARVGDLVRVRRAVRTAMPDYVVVQTSHEWPAIVRDLVLLGAIRRFPSRVILHFHGGHADRLVAPGGRRLKQATRRLLALSDGVLVLSSAERRAFEAFHPAVRIQVVSNPFERVSGTTAASDRPRKGEEPPVILFVGRLIREKGIFEAIDALALLSERRPARLVIAGDGPAKDDVASYARERGVSDQITLAGHVAADRLWEFYAAADVFVLPTYHPEGFPTAITEAMSVGLPIVTTNARGMADHLQEGANALFVLPRDATALAQALERVLTDDSLRERMSLANRREVEKFAPERVAREYLDALARIGSS